jgi:hypothetical protein
MSQKIFRLKTVMMLVLLVGALALANTAAADTYYASTHGYAYMGGNINTGNDSYFIAGPMEYDFAGSDMWGFAYIKFENIGTETVDAAYLNLDLLKVGSMNLEDATEDYPGIVDLYSPGGTDVAGLDAASAATLHDTLKASSSPFVEEYTMTENGVWAIDITELYNAWVLGTVENNGIVLISDSANANAAGGAIGAVGAKFAGLDGSEGVAPSISTVPVPGAVWLLGSGLLGIIGLRRRKG